VLPLRICFFCYLNVTLIVNANCFDYITKILVHKQKRVITHLFFAIISLQFFWEGGLYRCLLVSKIIKLLRQFNKNSELIPASCKSCVSRPTNSRRAVRIGRKM